MDELRKKIDAAISSECNKRLGPYRCDANDMKALTDRVMRVLEEEVEPYCVVVDRFNRKLFFGTRKEVRDWLYGERFIVEKMIAELNNHLAISSDENDVAVYMCFPYDRRVSVGDFLIMWS